jgi:hypothetical protein
MDRISDDSVAAWMRRSADDARHRGLPELVPLIESLGRAVTSLREADWNDNARGDACPDLGDEERPR